MQTQRSPAGGCTPASSIEATQCVILDELIDSYPAQLSEPELTLLAAGQVADQLPTDARDALLELRGSGLVHERDGYWWATRPAERFAALGYSR